MRTFAEFTSQIENPGHRARVEEVLDRIAKKFPALGQRIAWNQPMFTDHGTFIIGFSVAINHMAVAPERAALERFSDEIDKSG